MRMSEAEYAELMLRRQPSPVPRTFTTRLLPTIVVPATPVLKPARHVPGKMNKTEAAYAALLDDEKRQGLIRSYWFERLTLKLGFDTRYTPDYFVLRPGQAKPEIHEVKGGFIRDDAMVKFKCAADMFSEVFDFYLCIKQGKKDCGGWKIERF